MSEIESVTKEEMLEMAKKRQKKEEERLMNARTRVLEQRTHCDWIQPQLLQFGCSERM